MNLNNGRVRHFIEHVERARKYRTLPRQLADMAMHKLLINISPSDYYWFQFYKGGKSWEEKSRYICTRNGSQYWPYENNHLKYNYLYRDKFELKTRFEQYGIPAPACIATIGESRDIRTEEQLYEILAVVDQDFALKPLSGACGKNVLVISVRNGDFKVLDKPITKEEIWRHVSADLKRGFLIEQRVHNTEEIFSINPSSLNTFRVITIKTADDVWRVAGCILKVGQGGSQIDNGGAGNIMMWMNESGITTTAFDFKEVKSITHHPDTGAALIGLEFECYQDVVDLALTGSSKFDFMGTLGWDVAATEEGPLAIETNAFWESRYVQKTKGSGLVTDELAKGLKKHNWYNRWNKNYMYPGFDKVRSKS